MPTCSSCGTKYSSEKAVVCSNCRKRIAPEGHSSATRTLDTGHTPRGGRRWLVPTLVVVLPIVLAAIVSVVGFAIVRSKSRDLAPVLESEQLVERALQGSVLVLTDDGNLGTGVYIQANPPLVLTSAHVVERNERVQVMVPMYYTDGQLITSLADYRSRKGNSVFAKVKKREFEVDLAVLELDQKPVSLVPIPLATRTSQPLDKVISVGNSSVKDESLWRFSSGEVRSRGVRKAPLSNAKMIHAMILETQSPVNRGDSGGGMLNARGELVGVVCGFKPSERMISWAIDLTTIREFLGYEPIPPTDEDRANVETVKVEPVEKDDRWSETELIANLKLPAKRIKAIRQAAARGRASIQAVPTILDLMATEKDDVFARDAQQALNAIGRFPQIPSATVRNVVKSRSYAAKVYVLDCLSHDKEFDASLVKDLLAVLDQPEAGLRERAIRCLGRGGATARTPTLPRLLIALEDADAGVRKASDAAIGQLGPYSASDFPLFDSAIGSPSTVRREAAFRIVLPLMKNDEQARKYAVPGLSDSSQTIVESCLDALALRPKVAAAEIAALDRLSRNSSPAIRKGVLGIFGTLTPTPTSRVLVRYAFENEPLPELKEKAEAILLSWCAPNRESIEFLGIILERGSPASRIRAIEIFGQCGPEAEPLVGKMLKLVEGSDLEVARLATKAIVATKIKTSNIVRSMQSALNTLPLTQSNEKVNALRTELRKALCEISQESFELLLVWRNASRTSKRRPLFANIGR